MQNKTGQIYYHYLNGLKGLACLLVMVGHYLAIYHYAEAFSPGIHELDLLFSSPGSFLLYHGYWLYLFFIVSGYLVSKSKITSFGDLFRKAVKRFLRLALPILFSYFVIYLLYLVLGFHTADTESLFQCKWFQSYYRGTYSIKDVLFSPITVLIVGDCSLDGPYWVLKMMFFSSLLIYLLNYLYGKLHAEEHEAIAFSALIVITLLSLRISPIVTACLMGMLVSLVENSDITSKPFFAVWFIIIGMLMYSVLPKTIISAFGFIVVLVYVPKVKFLNRLFSSKIARFFGKISWGVFSFHWPVICSFGALSIMGLSERIGLGYAYCVTFFWIIPLTLVFSVCFYYSLERFADFLTKKADAGLSLLLGKLKNIPGGV